jgi:hypothetical protein
MRHSPADLATIFSEVWTARLVYGASKRVMAPPSSQWMVIQRRIATRLLAQLPT